jgi:protein O-mannosyl-transferase
VGPSIFVAALFAVHPLNVESVAWAAERKNVLSTFFFFLTIAAYARYAKKPDWGRYVPVALLFAAGLMAKPMVITLPFVLVLLDYWPLGRFPPESKGSDRSVDSTEGVPPMSQELRQVSFRKLLLEKIPLLLLSVASAWVTMIAQRGAERTFQEFPLPIRLENAVLAYGLYLWKMLWPAHLAFYPYGINALPVWRWMISAMLLILVSAGVVIFRHNRYLPVGWFWFLGTLVPVIGLVQVGEASMADRYAYIPLIGIFVMIAWSLSDWADAKRVGLAGQAIPALFVLAGLGFVSHRQMRYWESDYDLWSHTLDLEQNELEENPLTHNALGIALMSPETALSKADLEDFPSASSRMDEARQHFERALELRRPHTQQVAYLPDMARTLNNLGSLDRIQNRMNEAREHCEEALKMYRQLVEQNPDAFEQFLAATLNNLGDLDRLQNRTDQARQHYEEALKINRQLSLENPVKYQPNLAMTLKALGLLDVTQNQMEDARAYYEEALTIDRHLAEQSPAAYQPNLMMTLNDFARVDAMENRLDEARRHYEQALNIERQLAEQNSAYLPGMAMTLNNLGRVEAMQNHIEESRARYQECLSILEKLAQNDSRYAKDAAAVDRELTEIQSQPKRGRTVFSKQ